MNDELSETPVDLSSVADRLRRHQSDLPDIEAKAASGGLPASLTATLSAFANLPGGGLVILGLDERAGFTPVALADRAGLKAALAARARQALRPPVHVDIFDATIDGSPVVAARVAELPATAKPCMVNRTGKAYLRFWDGDYEMSQIELDGFVASRQRPTDDEAPVANAVVADLDSAMVDRYLNEARTSDRRLGRFSDDGDVLVKTGVVTPGGVPTTAGLLALGGYPQQFLPQYVVRAALLPGERSRPDVRALDEATFTGPIPAILDDAVAWVGRNSRRSLIEDPASGTVRDEPELPPLAVRELVANALVHRDLASWSGGRAIELRLTPAELRLTNPGGLYGVTVERLGRTELTSARNRRLIEICKFLRTGDGRVVEALATGIPTVLRSLDEAGLPPPLFFDQGLSFTVILRRTGADGGTRRPSASVGIRAAESEVLKVLTGPRSAVEVADSLGVSPSTARKRLASLVAKNLVIVDGGRGQQTTYRLNPR